MTKSELSDEELFIYDHINMAALCINIKCTVGKVAGSNSDEVIGFFNWRNRSSRPMVLGSTQPLTEMNTRNFLWGKGRPARKADNLTAICEPII
jgi:hypothetical protein